MSEPTTAIHVDAQQINTLLAALRYYQHQGMCEPDNRPDWLQDIACPTDDDTSEDAAGVDELCELINLGRNDIVTESDEDDPS